MYMYMYISTGLSCTDITHYTASTVTVIFQYTVHIDHHSEHPCMLAPPCPFSISTLSEVTALQHVGLIAAIDGSYATELYSTMLDPLQPLIVFV